MSRHSAGLLVWEDLRFPAAAVNPPGQVSDPDFDTTIGGLLFDNVTQEIIFLQAQLPHSWANTDLKPHVHWQKTTSAAGTVFWQLEYRWASIGQAMDGDWTILSSDAPAISDADTADLHAITPLGTIPCGGREISDMLIMRLSRVPASDTYADDARLLEFDIHYQKNALGSEKEFERIQN